MSTLDPYAGRADVSTQAKRWADITPGDTSASDLATLPSAVWADVAGTIKMTGSDGVACTFTVPAGTPLPLQPTRIWSTGTTATGIKALFS